MSKGIFLAGKSIESYSVVISENAKEIERLAAERFTACIERITEKSLSFINDSQSAPYEIVIGSAKRDRSSAKERLSQLKNDGIAIYFDSDERLIVTGDGDFGVMNAVCTLLEKFGYRFFDEKTEAVLGDDDVYLDSDFELFYSPVLTYRKTDWRLSRDMMMSLGLNGELTERNSIIGFAHTIGRLAETGYNGQPCLSDEGVYETVLRNVRKTIEEHPDCRIISVTQNDNFDYCKCEKCSSLAEREGQSGVLLNFINRLAADIEKDHPEVYILTFAYQYTRKPPKTIVPRRNVIIWLCSIECCFSHPLESDSCEQNKAFSADIMAWGKICDKLMIWDYTTNYAYYNSPFPDFRTLLPNARFFADHGAIGIYEEGGYQQAENGEFRSLRAYLTGKILKKPYMSNEEYYSHMDEFLACYYGKGWMHVREYIDRCASLAERIHLGIYIRPEMIFVNENGEPDISLLEELDSLWQKAISTADTDTHRLNCQNSSIQSRYMLARVRSIVHGRVDPAENKALLDAMKGAGIVYHTEHGGALPVDKLDENTPIEKWRG